MNRFYKHFSIPEGSWLLPHCSVSARVTDTFWWDALLEEIAAAFLTA